MNERVTKSYVGYRLRVATLDDEPCLRHLIARSIRGLGAEASQIDAALGGTFGVDTAIIRDETYFVAVTDASIIAASAAQSWRGASRRPSRQASQSLN